MTRDLRKQAGEWLEDEFTPRNDPPKVLLVTAVFLAAVGLGILLLRRDIWPLGVVMLVVAAIQLGRAISKSRRGVDGTDSGDNDADL